jgi:hypothetical protein
MRIRLAHLRDQGINFAVFAADAPTHTRGDRDIALRDLTSKARAAGLRVDKAALAFTEHGRLTFYGTPDLVRYLSQRGGAPRWTHWIEA